MGMQMEASTEKALHEYFVFPIRNAIGLVVLEIALYQKDSIGKYDANVCVAFNINIGNSFTQQLNYGCCLQRKLFRLLHNLASREKTVTTLDVHPR